MPEQQPQDPSGMRSAESTISEAVEKCAQELKALALIYQSYNRPRWAKETYSAFLKTVKIEDKEVTEPGDETSSG